MADKKEKKNRFAYSDDSGLSVVSKGKETKEEPKKDKTEKDEK